MRLHHELTHKRDDYYVKVPWDYITSCYTKRDDYCVSYHEITSRVNTPNEMITAKSCHKITSRVDKTKRDDYCVKVTWDYITS